MTTHYIQTLGVAKCREILKWSPSNAETYIGGYYVCETPQFMFHNGFHDQWNLTDNNGAWFKDGSFIPVVLSDLRAELSLHDTDSCTDIRNHVSPNTVVVG